MQWLFTKALIAAIVYVDDEDVIPARISLLASCEKSGTIILTLIPPICANTLTISAAKVAPLVPPVSKTGKVMALGNPTGVGEATTKTRALEVASVVSQL